MSDDLFASVAAVIEKEADRQAEQLAAEEAEYGTRIGIDLYERIDDDGKPTAVWLVRDDDGGVSLVYEVVGINARFLY